ncbi:MAG: hypothetical protein HY762_02080 [Planctomycetes bacterium]|nr:hypothetical protein [Planctomycetota bacterium]
MNSRKLLKQRLLSIAMCLVLAINIIGCNGVSQKPEVNVMPDAPQIKYYVTFKNDFYLLEQKNGEMRVIDKLVGGKVSKDVSFIQYKYPLKGRGYIVENERGVGVSTLLENKDWGIYGLDQAINGYKPDQPKITSSSIPIHLSYSIYRGSISETTLDFSPDCEFQENVLAEQWFKDIKWGEKVPFVITGKDYLLLVITQPILQKTEEIK